MSEDIIGQDIHHEHISHDAIEKAHSGLNTKVIWKVFWILLGITIFEVSIAFSPIPHEILIYTYVFLTLVKAYYIVGFFMHLKFEKKQRLWEDTLIRAVIYPVNYYIWFVVLAHSVDLIFDRLLSEQFGDTLLQPVDRRVLAILVVADRCGRHRLAHSGRRRRHGVRTQVDAGHQGASACDQTGVSPFSIRR